MKIDKRNIAHWIYLALFTFNVICAMGLRFFRRRRSTKRVVLYGHKLSGNLLAIYQYLCAPGQSDMEAVFLTLDPVYHRELSRHRVSNVLAIAPSCTRLLSRTDAVISDHGLHALWPMLFSSVKFFDVWHGIPFKGFDAADFRVQHRYDEIWVASPLLARMYVERLGFEAEKVRVTGYARTDRLVRRGEGNEAIKRRLGLEGGNIGKIVLFAPTWRQDSRERSIYPFGTDGPAFYRALSEIGQRTGSTFVMRTHMNSGGGIQPAATKWEHVFHLPHAEFPDTEEILLVSDMLVCDWSSIAFDFLLMERPTIFLDVEAPFAKGFSLSPDYRFGAVTSSMDDLLLTMECYLTAPSAYQKRFSALARRVGHAVYAGYADGAASKRCVERLRHHLSQTR